MSPNEYKKIHIKLTVRQVLGGLAGKT